MNDLSFPEFVAIGFGSLVAIYIVARLVTAAFFKSKQHYERGSK